MTRGFLLVVMSATLFGGTGVAGAIVAANSGMSWPAISALRVFLGGLVLLGLTALTGELQRIPRGKGAGRRILLTGVGTAVYTTAYFQSVPLIGVAVATVVCLGSAPLAIAGYTAVRERRMPSAGTQVALVAALAGLVLVSDPDRVGTSAAELALGIALALTSGLSFAATTVINRTAIPGLGPRVLIATSLTVAGLLAAPVAFLAGADLASMGWPAWTGIGFLAIFQTAFAYMAFYAGLQAGLPPTTAVIVLLIEPVTAMVLAMVILSETPTAAAVAGMALMMLAIVLVRPAPDKSPSYSRVSGQGESALAGHDTEPDRPLRRPDPS